MATFYVLPSRQVLGQRCGDLLAGIFPGAQASHWNLPDLAESVAGLLESQAEAFVVYREDLDENLTLNDSLMQHFGAEPHDAIVEIRFGRDLHHVLHQFWSTEPSSKAA